MRGDTRAFNYGLDGYKLMFARKSQSHTLLAAEVGS